jgi:hypothetical protein
MICDVLNVVAMRRDIGGVSSPDSRNQHYNAKRTGLKTGHYKTEGLVVADFYGAED